MDSKTGKPSVDSNGTRYLGYVWYRNSESDTFKNLNLELTENGYTDVVSPIGDYNLILTKQRLLQRSMRCICGQMMMIQIIIQIL